MSKFLAKLGAFDFSNKYFSSLRNCHTRQLCYYVCRLTDYFRIERAVDDNSLSDFVKLVTFKKIAASSCKFLSYCVINTIMNYDRLL